MEANVKGKHIFDQAVPSVLPTDRFQLWSTSTKNLNTPKTRANAALRKQLMQMGDIRPAAATPELQALKHKGHIACSRTEAILARRREMGRG